MHQFKQWSTPSFSCPLQGPYCRKGNLYAVRTKISLGLVSKLHHERTLILLGELEHNYFFNTVCSSGASKQKLLMFPLKQGFMYANYFLFYCACSQYLFNIKAMSIILPQNTNMRVHGSLLTCLLIKSQNACSQQKWRCVYFILKEHS